MTTEPTGPQPAPVFRNIKGVSPALHPTPLRLTSPRARFSKAQPGWILAHIPWFGTGEWRCQLGRLWEDQGFLLREVKSLVQHHTGSRVLP